MTATTSGPRARTDLLKLHLGCGTKFLPGFVHIDALDLGHIDQVGPVESLPQIASGSVDLIYASHVLEHFGRHEYQDVLQEWYRVLRPGGLLRLAVPDFTAMAEEYVSGRLRNGLSDLVGLCVGGQRDQLDYHKMVFDAELLTTALMAVGFSDVVPWDWRTIEHSDVDDYSQAYLPHMDKDAGRLMSLNLEATK